ncbi:MAG: murein DD-endopeptidase MepM/ murein hydrolase activator NlpD [Bacteroidia bacterium]|jgi:murein DD-endopeptidase MepM/ murein hydrolase activator NlpD
MFPAKVLVQQETQYYCSIICFDSVITSLYLKTSQLLIATILIGLSISLVQCKPDKSRTRKNKTPEVITEEPVVAIDSFSQYYGLTLNRFEDKIDSFSVRRNSVFSNLFDNYITDDSLLFEAIGIADTLFPINKIIAGNSVHMVHRKMPKGKKAASLIYHISETDKLILGFKDSAYAFIHHVPLDTVERTIYAKIDNTLYHSILAANTSYELGIELSEVFAWQVNFFRIDKNDFFKVIFDEYQVEGRSVEIGPIKAALFYHRGDSFYAFPYKRGEDDGYFDEAGENLKKAFLKAPLKYSRISSRYTKRRFHPVQKRWKAHLGTDYAAPRGTPIRTVGDGRIVAASYSRGNGRYVKVKHNSRYTTQYLHMSRIAGGIKKGKYVKQGEVIGYVGSTGLATGPHLCFRFWDNGVQVDPFKIKAPPTTPVSEENKADFTQIALQRQNALNLIQLSVSDSTTTSSDKVD